MATERLTMSEQQLGAIRHTMSTLGGYMATCGWVDVSIMDGLIGIMMIIVPFAWSWKSKSE